MEAPKRSDAAKGETGQHGSMEDNAGGYPIAGASIMVLGFCGLYGWLSVRQRNDHCRNNRSPFAQEFILGAIALLALKTCTSRELGGKSRTHQATYVLGVIIFAAVIGVSGFYFIESKRPKPSFVFVSPAGWFKGRWGLMVAHKGPDATFNVRVMLSDMAQQYMNRSLTPEEIRRTTLVRDFSEIDPNPAIGPPPGFSWEPITPDHEDFLIELSYRGGVILEHLFIERIDIDRWAIGMRVALANEPIALIECQDPLFPASHPWSNKRLKPCTP